VLSFRAKEWVWVARGAGGSWAALIEYPTLTEAEAASMTIGSAVRIDLQDYEVAGIERFAITGWYRQRFGIYVRGAPRGMGAPANSIE
jgi:hypothetical protein